VNSTIYLAEQFHPQSSLDYQQCKTVVVTILSRDRVTIDGVWIGNWIYWTLQHTTRDYTLQITITHRLVFSATVFTELLGSGFQRLTFPFLWFPKLFPASASSFCNCQLTACRLSLGSWSSLYIYSRHRLHRKHFS
jgi:hypothetical protein